jgi:uncharacterized protein (TIGR02246 family)
MMPRTVPCIVIAAALLATACGDSDDTTATVDPPTTSTTVAATTTQPPTTTTLPATTDAATAETDRIIEAWIDAWIREDADGVADLYAEDGTYADIGCPFEMNGRPAIRNMVAGHLGPADYTIVERVETTYTESGAVVQWVWGGTYDLKPFTMEPSTTFEINNGLITRSTDAYERTESPPSWEQACIDYAGE